MSFARVTVSSNKSVVNMYNLHFIRYSMYVYTTYTRPLSVQAQYSRACSIISSSCYDSSLVIWTVVCLTVTKFKPLIFSVSGFALSNVANIYLSWLLLVACIIMLYNHILVHTEVWKPCANVVVLVFVHLKQFRSDLKENTWFYCSVVALYRFASMDNWLMNRCEAVNVS
jgi:hypothetical protein